ncbi:MAG: hypothetical protein Kow0020_05100 [Wenzhouxiangellaceae bacterium]
MSKTTAVICVLSSGLLLGACATRNVAPSGADTPTADAQFDAAYMAVVDHSARKQGVRVIWVNPPRKQGDDGSVRISYPPLDLNDSDG